jgi:hypothetical protein
MRKWFDAIAEHDHNKNTKIGTSNDKKFSAAGEETPTAHWLRSDFVTAVFEGQSFPSSSNMTQTDAWLQAKTTRFYIMTNCKTRSIKAHIEDSTIDIESIYIYGLDRPNHPPNFVLIKSHSSKIRSSSLLI